MNAKVFEMTDDLRDAMNRLLQATSNFALVANQHYARSQPESAGDYATLWKDGALITDCRVQLTPGEHRLAFGFTNVADGTWQPIVELAVSEAGERH